MNKLMDDRLKAVATYVETAFSLKRSPELWYHNLVHTKAVVKHVNEMADFYHLPDTDRFVLLVAAWFHDIGHLYGSMNGHEEESVRIMENYFRDKDIDSSLLVMIKGAILATQMDREPNTLLEKIMRDSDMYHLGTDEFCEVDQKVWKEIESRTGGVVMDKLKKSLSLLNQHCFYTDYCKDRLLLGKEANKAFLKSSMKGK